MTLPPITALRDAAVTFGGRETFEGISFGLSRGERTCLVGRNGSGKSTLLRAIAGAIELDRGERFVQPGARVAYMPQDALFDPASTALKHVLAGTNDVPGHVAEAMLAAVGIDPDRSLVGLSGGEGRRISLARVFAARPDILLLDEPTNHLDIRAIEWLEGQLDVFPGAILTVSHDRALLRRLATRVLWLDRGRLRSMDRPYAEFDNWSAGIVATEAAEQDRLDKKIARETVWLHQGISARRTRNMGRVRALAALREARAARVSMRDAKLGTPEARAGGRLVVELDKVAKRFPATADTAGHNILDGFSTRILRGDRIGIVGPNGAGKSSLLKILLGTLDPDAGRVRHGTGLQPAVLDQRREGLDPDRSVRDNLADSGDTVFVQGEPRHVNGYLRDFLFEDRQVRQPVRQLSGGERNRLLLAKILAQPSNVLVLDEPTNDLDMETLDLLEELLAEYQGTLFLVSHDRDFLDRLVTSVIAVDGDGKVAEYVGGYTDYVRQRPPLPAPQSAPVRKPAQPREPKARPMRLSFNEQHELKTLPVRMEQLGQERETLRRNLAESDFYARDRIGFETASARLAAIEHELAQAEDRWLELELKRDLLDA